MSNIDFQSQISNRYLSIDFLKGFIILLMTFVNTMAYFDLTPTWTRHADVYGLTYVDLIAPCFIFLLVINFHLSYEKRIKYDSKIKVFRHFIIRNLILLALGLILYIDVSGSQLQLRWGTLQYIASTGFIILLCVRLPKTIRLIIGIIGMFIYQIFLLPPYRVIIYNSIEGGIIGIISWASIGLLSSFLATGLIKNTHKDVKLYFLYFGLIILFFGKIVRIS
ncbi:MAG: heparan-alpha-glucosaminide N-acetyltransferase domain-containing protein [Candidatus Lokiarchaeota archaeon]